MSKRISTEKDEFNPERIAEHLKQYADENFLTFDDGKPNATKIGKALGLHRHTITKLLKGEDQKNYSEKTFQDIAKITGIIKEYWLGKTEQKTEVDYRKEKFKEAQLTSKISQLELIQDSQYSDEIDRYTNLFKSLGYTYECPDSCRYQGFPHILTNNTTNEKTEFTTDEINQLLQDLKNTVAFACFKKERATQQIKREPQNGD